MHTQPEKVARILRAALYLADKSYSPREILTLVAADFADLLTTEAQLPCRNEFLLACGIDPADTFDPEVLG